MKRTKIFLPKFFHAAIFISVAFGLAVFGAGAGGKISAAGRAGQILSEESEISKQQNDHHQSKTDNSSRVQLKQSAIETLNRFSVHMLPSFLSSKANINDTILAARSAVNNIMLSFLGDLTIGTMMTTAPSQPAERFINKSAITDAQIETGFTEKYTNRFIELMSIGVTPVYASENGSAGRNSSRI